MNLNYELYVNGYKIKTDKATSPLDNNSDEYIDKFIENLKLDPFGYV